MSLQAILEIAIGLLFAWLVLSMAAMYVQEWIVTRLSWRSSMLEAYIRNMLADPAMADQFYDHPLIKALHTGEDGERRPAYIPSRQFSLALFDIVINAGKSPSGEAFLLTQEIHKLRASIETLKKDEKARAEAQFDLVLKSARAALKTQTGSTALENAIANVKMELGHLGKINPLLQDVIDETLGKVEANASDVDAILKGIQENRPKQSEGETGEAEILTELRNGITVLAATQPHLQQALESLLRGAEGQATATVTTIALARQNLEKWFDDGMDRLSGWFKRRSQKLALVIGFAVAVALNADTLALAQTLWREPVVRQALATQAEAFTKNNEGGLQPASAEQLNALQIQFSTLNIPIGWVGTPLPADAGGGVMLPDGSQKKCTLWPTSMLDYYGLKMGYRCYPIVNAPPLNDIPGVFLKLFGLFASGLAAAQGAPFWFDILKKAVNIRTSGANPAEATTKAAG